MPGGAGNLILAIQISSVRNAARSVWSANPVEMLVLGGVAVLLAAYEAADTYRSVARCAACHAAVYDHPGISAVAALIVTGAAGVSAGCASAVCIRSLADASWLAVLSWSHGARQSAMRHAMAAHGASAFLGITLFMSAACRALNLSGAFIFGAAFGLSGVAGFGAGAALCRNSRPKMPHGPDARPRQPARRLPTPLHILDRLAPCHAGLWAWSGRVRLILATSALSLIPLGSAAAASVAQHQAIPAMAVAVIGGNLVFVLALRCVVLRSSVFRASPVRFAAAAASMARAPLALSGAWFLAVLAAPVACSVPMRQIAPAGGLALLILDGLYLAAALFRPHSPRQAVLLYASGAYAIIYETATAGLPYGVLTLAAVGAMASILLRRARRSYRSGHG